MNTQETVAVKSRRILALSWALGSPAAVNALEGDTTEDALVEMAAKRIYSLERQFNFQQHLERQRTFSERTFGPGMRTQGVVDHIRKELVEVLAKPDDLSEWIDVAILALDGAWRAGYTSEQIIAAMVAKQTKNEGRQWPDWRTMPADQAIEHVRTELESLDTSEREAVEPKP